MNRIKQLRKNKNLNQYEFAKYFNVDRSTISKWEQGKTLPDILTLEKIATFFNVTVDYLIGKNDFLKPQEEIKENTIRIIGRGGKVKEVKVTDEQRKAFETLLGTIDHDVKI